MILDQMPRLLLALIVVIISARLCGALARRLGQPAVIGEIAGGILLGPTLFGGAITRAIFPTDIRPALSVLANIGVCVFMFLVGLHFDRGLLRGQGRIATTVSLSAIALPFGLGALLALYLAGNHPPTNRLAFVLFLGTAMSITAFPVLARILTDKGLIDTPIGGLALACAAVDDVLAWSLLAVVAALADGGGEPWRILLVVPFVAVMVKVVRPLLARAARRRPVGGASAGGASAGGASADPALGDPAVAAPGAVRRGPVRRGLTGAGVLVAVAAGLLLCAEATEWMGLHRIFGAFLFGAIMPTGGAAALRERALPWIERISSTVLLPVFFIVAGIKVNLSAMDLTGLGELGLILLVAIGGKCVGAFIGARLNGVRPRHSAVLALLINTRGLTELIVLTVGLQLAVLDQSLYSLMVVMALVTTAMAGVLLRFVYPPELVRRDTAAREANAVYARGPVPVPKESAP